MKKSFEFMLHTILWVMFTISVLAFSKISLKATPDAPFGQHLPYVVFLELIMGLLFFYITYFGASWARKSVQNKFILSFILILLLIVFAIPAFRSGSWEALSSVVPHAMLILLGLVFKGFSDYTRMGNKILV